MRVVCSREHQLLKLTSDRKHGGDCEQNDDGSVDVQVERLSQEQSTSEQIGLRNVFKIQFKTV